MKSTLYLLNYNQYYNRILKKYNTLEEYLPFVVYNGEQHKLTNSAFNPSNGIDTQIIVNVPDANFDYLLVVDENGEIVSRWFVSNAFYLKGEGVRTTGQYQLSLHRDLLADYLNEVMAAPLYLERSIFTVDNPFIYNSENLVFNQIKTTETPLYDNSKCPWVVAYLARNNESKVITAEAPQYQNQYVFPKSQLVGKTFFGDTPTGMYITTKAQAYHLTDEYYITIYANTNGDHVDSKEYSRDPNATRLGDTYTDNVPGLVSGFTRDFVAAVNRKVADGSFSFSDCFFETLQITPNQAMVQKVLELQDKVIFDPEDNTYYKIQVSSMIGGKPLPEGTAGPTPIKASYEIPPSSNYGLKMKEIMAENSYTYQAGSLYEITGKVFQVTVSHNFETVSGNQYQMTIPSSATRLNTKDAPWDILAMPLPIDNEVFFDFEDFRLTQKADIALQLGQALSLQYGAENVYDVQLLPYCPIMQYYNEETGRFDCRDLTEGVHYSPIKYSNLLDQPTMIGLGFWVDYSSFSNSAFLPTPITNPTDPIEFKVNNECDMYRLVSPNYSSAFEFTATKNGGILGFEINATYKPFQPMIHVNPIFSGLYGRDFDDSRGLVCAGDFSLPSTTSAWTSFQIQNKSYKQSFARQIENMETTYDLQREQLQTAGTINALTSGISGAASGFTSGTLASGNPLVGGAVGLATGTINTAASIYGLSKDLEYQKRQHREDLSYAKDMFNYNLQNIKALPNTLNNIGAFDINYKYVPFLEYYTATPEEKDALRKKIQYNGMTAGFISSISQIPLVVDYPQFIQGQLIRIDELKNDYNIAVGIANELHQGIYITKGE